MYREAYQRGMLTVFFSGGSKPLEIWETKTRDGFIKRFLDPEIKTMVLEIRGSNISTTYMVCPKGNQILGITMPFLVMIVKNLMKYFSFEVTVLDSTGTRRRFRVSNFQSTTQILPLCTVMPIGLAPGWNQIQFNLAEFTRRAYKNQFVEVQKLKINANIRVRRIYFTEKLMSDDELPMEYKLYFPLQQKGTKAVKERETDKHIICVAKDETEDKKAGIDSTKPELKSASAGSIKKTKKSLQTMTVPEEGKEVKGEQTDATIEETAGEGHPHGEEETKEDKEQKVTGEETGIDEEVAGETEEKQSTVDAEEVKGEETGEKEDKADDLDKGAEDKGEGEPKPDEEHDKGDVEEKPAEEKAAEEAETAT